MRSLAQKQNEFTSFSKLLTKIDTTNLGDYELKILKQEHDYLDRLRHQRLKIEEMKKKYDDCESAYQQQRETNAELAGIVEDKCRKIDALEQELSIEIAKRENLERTLQRLAESDKNKSKNRVKDLQHENQQLKKQLRQKQLLIIQLEEEHSEKTKKIKQSYQIDRRNLLMEREQLLNQFKSKNTDNEMQQLRNLVSRQNKALKMQNEKVQQLSHQVQSLSEQLESVKSEYGRKEEENFLYEEKIKQLYEQLESLQNKLEKQDHNNRLKGQLDEIRRKMNQMQKGEIERIEFIVNEQDD